MSGRAIVLAGGLGTRLRGVVSDRPKPMAPVSGKPFLEYILRKLSFEGIAEVRLSVGHLWEMIRDYFGEEFLGIKLDYVVEEEPLGTGGGLLLAFGDWEDALVLNGDTFFDCDLQDLLGFSNENQADMALALKRMKDFDRYGTVEMSGNRVTGFREKMPMKEGLINAGVYVLRKKVFQGFAPGDKFSFEEEILQPGTALWKMIGKEYPGYFIDIGIPEDYEKANEYFAQNR
jgi:D-glycero-alpha-D-manno-heptose 1-phosphate guanylyltransferase